MNPLAIRAFAPGRVNLIGEHTDYNRGLCLPFAIESGVTVTVELRAEVGVDAASLPAGDPYLRGAVTELAAIGIEPPGCSLDIASDLPQGAGLASSAALCVSLVLALCGAAGAEPPPPHELARLCSRIENDYAGAATGLLDQLASLLGQAGHALRLDMRTLEAEPVQLGLGPHTLAVLDSGAPRALAASGYNERRAECRRAAELLGVKSLRDAAELLGAEAFRDAGDLAGAEAIHGAGRSSMLPHPLDRRVRHVLTENARVDAAVEALRAGGALALGELLDASHASLRDDYEVSVPEVERAVEACRDAGALGARIMGGGFGGSVLALFPADAALPEGAIAVRPGPGARLLC
jgi:galactokinase